MSSVSRRFGTDVSNIPSEVLRKTSSKKISNKPHVYAAKSSGSNPSSKVSQPKSSPLIDVMESLMDTLKISLDDEITIKSPVKLPSSLFDQFRYERDFLMQLQEMSYEPIDGLIPEVLPGYVPPEVSSDVSSVPRSQLRSSSSSHTNVKSLGSAITSDSSTSPSSESSSVKPTPESSSALSKEWRVKKVKKQKPREQDARRLAARQKQIDIGMNTIGYQQFMATVPVNARNKSHPRIPDIHQVCSKRSWDGQVRKWRRQLHDYDPASAAGQPFEMTYGSAGTDQHATGGDEDSDDDDDADDDGETLDA